MRHSILLCACCMTVLLSATGVRADVGATVREIIENQHRILILREATGVEDRAEARRAGQYLFFRNKQLGRALVGEVTQSARQMPVRYREMIRVLDESTCVDEDRLILRSALESLVRRLPPDESRDASQRLGHLAELRTTLGGSFEAAFQHIPLKSGRAHRSSWEAYVARLVHTTTAHQILMDMDHELVIAPGSAADQMESVGRARVLEWNGEELPAKMVLLTFDDGPHPIHTPEVLDILKGQGVHAIFFQIGRNLGEVKQGVALPGHNQAIVSRLLLEGHAIGNHSFTPLVLPKLDSQSVAREIADTQTLIEAMVPEGLWLTPESSGAIKQQQTGQDADLLLHLDDLERAIGGAFGTTVAGVAVLQHRDLAPALLLEGEQPQRAGGNASAATRATGRIDVGNPDWHGKTHLALCLAS